MVMEGGQRSTSQQGTDGLASYYDISFTTIIHLLQLSSSA